MATPTSLPATFVAGNVLTAAEMNDLRGAFRILQVVSTTKTDTFSAAMTAGNTTSVTGLSAAITPSSTASKILIVVSLDGATSGGGSGRSQAIFQVVRGGTSIGAGDAAGVRGSVMSGQLATTSPGNGMASVVGQFLDSPATTSATTYQVDIYAASTETYYVNRSGTDTNNTATVRTSSTITVMEVSA